MNRFDQLRNLDQEIQAILKRYDPTYKIEIVRINISSSFMARARCTECGKGPTYYYYIRKPFLWKNIRTAIATSKWIREWVKSFGSSWFLESEPKHFHDIQEFSFILENKQYRPTLFRTRGSDIKDKDNVIEMVGCDCGATVWAFNQKSVKNRPEITNRKGRYKYPQRFDY